MYLLIRIRLSISSVAEYCQKLLSCKTDAFHCLYGSTVPVYHKCSATNQVQACDVSGGSRGSSKGSMEPPFGFSCDGRLWKPGLQQNPTI